MIHLAKAWTDNSLYNKIGDLGPVPTGGFKNRTSSLATTVANKANERAGRPYQATFISSRDVARATNNVILGTIAALVLANFAHRTRLSTIGLLSTGALVFNVAPAFYTLGQKAVQDKLFDKAADEVASFFN